MSLEHQVDAVQYAVTSCFGEICNTASSDLIYDSMMLFNCPKVSLIFLIRQINTAYRTICCVKIKLL